MQGGPGDMHKLLGMSQKRARKLAEAESFMLDSKPVAPERVSISSKPVC